MRTAPKITVLAALSALVVLLAGCATPDAEFATRVKAHIDPMKQVYERGVATYPNADDQRIQREHMRQLDRLLEAGGAK